MYSITLKHGDKQLPVRIDDILSIIEKYGDKRVELAKYPTGSRVPVTQESRRKLTQEVRQILFTEVEQELYHLLMQAIVGFDMAQYAFHCEACNRGFNSLDDVIAHVSDFDNVNKEECRAAMIRQLSNGAPLR